MAGKSLIRDRCGVIKKTLSDIKSEFLSNDPEILTEYFDNNYDRYVTTLSELDLNVSPAKSVLDVGILPGHMAMCMNKLGFRVSGISFGRRVEAICSQALNNLKGMGIEIAHLNIESSPLPFPDDKYDYIMFTDVIEHLSSNLMEVMAELGRVLKPGGKLIVSTPNVANIGNRIEISKGRNIYWQMYQFYERDSDDRHNREFTLGEVKDLLGKTGFRVVRTRYLMHMPEAALLRDYRSSLPKLVKARIVYLLAKFYPPFRSLFLVVAEKSE